MTAEKKPWYKDGLKFSCTGCGDCCTGAPGYVWVNKEEIAAMAKTVKLTVEEFEDQYTRKIGIRRSLKEFGNGDCVFSTISQGSAKFMTLDLASVKLGRSGTAIFVAKKTGDKHARNVLAAELVNSTS